MLKRIGRWSLYVSRCSGSPPIIMIAISSLIGFLLVGPIFHFSDGYQLAFNTFMSAVSYLLLFILQSTTNRDSQLIQIKLNEILRALPYTDKSLINIEDLTEDELDKITNYYVKLSEEFRARK